MKTVTVRLTIEHSEISKFFSACDLLKITEISNHCNGEISITCEPFNLFYLGRMFQLKISSEQADRFHKAITKMNFPII